MAHRSAVGDIPPVLARGGTTVEHVTRVLAGDGPVERRGQTRTVRLLDLTRVERPVAGPATDDAALAARAARMTDVAMSLAAVAEPLQRTDDAVTSLSNLAHRSGDPRVERLASLARQRLAELRASTRALRSDLVALDEVTPPPAAVGLTARLLRARRTVVATSPNASLRVDVLHRPLTIAADGDALERRLVRLLGVVTQLAVDAAAHIEVARIGDDAVVRVRWPDPVPVTELVRAACLAEALHHGSADTAANVVTRGGTTTATLTTAAARTTPDSTTVAVRLPLRAAHAGHSVPERGRIEAG